MVRKGSTVRVRCWAWTHDFRLVFDRTFLETIVTRVDAYGEIYKKILDDEDLRAALGEILLRRAYERLRDGA